MNIVGILLLRRIKQTAVDNCDLLFNAAVKDDLSGLTDYRKALRSVGAEFVKTAINKTTRSLTVTFKYSSFSFFLFFYWSEERPVELHLKEWRASHAGS